MPAIRLLGDEVKAGSWIPKAKKMLSELKKSMDRLGLVCGSDVFPLPDGGRIRVTSIKNSQVYFDQITIKTGGGFATAYFVFVTEWGIQGFEMTISRNEAALVPKDLPNITEDDFSILTNAWIDRETMEFFYGSAVSSISRDRKKYYFKVPTSTLYYNALNLPNDGGFAHDVYADKIYSYGTRGYRWDTFDLYGLVSEPASAGTDLVYPPYSLGIPISNNSPETNPGPTFIDAIGRRNYKVDFINKKILRDNEYVDVNRYSRVDKYTWMARDDWNWIYEMDAGYRALVIAQSPPNLTTNPNYSEITYGIPNWNSYYPYTSVIIEYTYYSDKGAYTNHLEYKDWWTYYFYQELVGTELVKKSKKLFLNTVEVDVAISWELWYYYWQGGYDYPCPGPACAVGTYPFWNMSSSIKTSNEVKYDVRACLGNEKFIYEKTTRHDVQSISYSPHDVYLGFEDPPIYSVPRYPLFEEATHNRYNAETLVYVGDEIVRTNHYINQHDIFYAPFHPWLKANDYDGMIQKYFDEEHESKEETFFMDYDYDVEHGKNGIFFIEDVHTTTDNKHEIHSINDGGHLGWALSTTDIIASYTFKLGIILGGSMEEIEIGDGAYTEERHILVENAGGLYETNKFTSYSKYGGGGTRVWLTSSYVSDREMVYSYAIENVSIADNGVKTVDIIKRIIGFINLKNPGLPYGYKREFTFLPIDEDTAPVVTITKLKGANSLLPTTMRVFVAAMNTVNMSKVQTIHDVELASDENGFNVSFDKTENATHYAVFISPSPNAQDGTGADNWFSPIITAETSIDIFSIIPSNDRRAESFMAISENNIKNRSMKLVPAIGIYRKAA